MPTPISRANAEHYVWGQVCNGWHLVRSADISIIQERVPPGGREVRHYHVYAWQFFYVLSGKAVLEVDGLRFVLTEQVGLEVPAGTPHQMVNESTEDVDFLVISRPPSQGDRVGA